MSIMTKNNLEFISRSPEQTRRVGMRLGALLMPGDLICLQGELGAGKTTFVQGLAQGWGALDAVSSPTFVLVNVYQRGGIERIFHMDAYRIESAADGEELDLPGMLGEGALIVEWPERLEGILPAEHLWLHIEQLSEEHRQLHLDSHGDRYNTLVADLRQAVFGVA